VLGAAVFAGWTVRGRFFGAAPTGGSSSPG
jgi:hypothetical protein